MEITMGYDENAIVHVFVRDLVTGQPVGELHLSRGANLDEGEIWQSRRRLEGLDVL